MRAFEEQELVLPAVRLAFATAARLADARAAVGRDLPRGWSVTEIASPDAGRSLLVQCDEDAGCLSFLLSDEAGTLDLHALVDEQLVLLGRRRIGGMAVVPSARAA